METFCLQFPHIQQPMSYCHGYSGAGGWAVTEYANPIFKLVFEEEWKYLIYVEKKTVRMITCFGDEISQETYSLTIVK